MVLWLAHREGKGEGQVRLKIPKTVFEPGEGVRFRAEVTDGAREPVEGAHLRATLEGPDGKKQAIRLDPEPGGLAERIGRSLSGLHPVAVFLLSAIGLWAIVAGISIALGHLVTDVLVPIDSVEDADEWLPHELATERTPFLDDVSWVFSTAAGGIVLPAIAAVLTVVCVILKRFIVAAFMVFALIAQRYSLRDTSRSHCSATRR